MAYWAIIVQLKPIDCGMKFSIEETLSHVSTYNEFFLQDFANPDPDFLAYLKSQSSEAFESFSHFSEELDNILQTSGFELDRSLRDAKTIWEEALTSSQVLRQFLMKNAFHPVIKNWSLYQADQIADKSVAVPKKLNQQELKSVLQKSYREELRRTQYRYVLQDLKNVLINILDGYNHVLGKRGAENELKYHLYKAIKFNDSLYIESLPLLSAYLKKMNSRASLRTLEISLYDVFYLFHSISSEPADPRIELIIKVKDAIDDSDFKTVKTSIFNLNHTEEFKYLTLAGGLRQFVLKHEHELTTNDLRTALCVHHLYPDSRVSNKHIKELRKIVKKIKKKGEMPVEAMERVTKESLKNNMPLFFTLPKLNNFIDTYQVPMQIVAPIVSERFAFDISPQLSLQSHFKRAFDEAKLMGDDVLNHVIQQMMIYFKSSNLDDLPITGQLQQFMSSSTYPYSLSDVYQAVMSVYQNPLDMYSRPMPPKDVRLAVYIDDLIQEYGFKMIYKKYHLAKNSGRLSDFCDREDFLELVSNERIKIKHVKDHFNFMKKRIKQNLSDQIYQAFLTNRPEEIYTKIIKRKSIKEARKLPSINNIRSIVRENRQFLTMSDVHLAANLARLKYILLHQGAFNGWTELKKAIEWTLITGSMEKLPTNIRDFMMSCQDNMPTYKLGLQYQNLDFTPSLSFKAKLYMYIRRCIHKTGMEQFEEQIDDIQKLKGTGGLRDFHRTYRHLINKPLLQSIIRNLRLKDHVKDKEEEKQELEKYRKLTFMEKQLMVYIKKAFLEVGQSSVVESLEQVKNERQLSLITHAGGLHDFIQENSALIDIDFLEQTIIDASMPDTLRQALEIQLQQCLQSNGYLYLSEDIYRCVQENSLSALRDPSLKAFVEQDNLNVSYYDLIEVFIHIYRELASEGKPSQSIPSNHSAFFKQRKTSSNESSKAGASIDGTHDENREIIDDSESLRIK